MPLNVKQAFLDFEITIPDSVFSPVTDQEWSNLLK